MTREKYLKLQEPYRENEKKRSRLLRVNEAFERVFYVIYIVTLAALLAARDARFFPVLIVPAVSFVFLSAARRIINRPRPYETLDFVPLIRREKKGCSFPSRHIFSVFLIAMAVFYLWVPGGILIMAAGAWLAVIRVVGGVHYPADVIVGAAVGIGCGILGFYALPAAGLLRGMG